MIIFIISDFASLNVLFLCFDFRLFPCVYVVLIGLLFNCFGLKGGWGSY